MNKTPQRVPGSFRDPSGYVFQQGDQLFRRITPEGWEEFAFFINSGLAHQLVHTKKLVPFFTTDDELTLQLEKLPFVSYPYEWSFSQLKTAALLTLAIMLEALENGMILKDGSAFNVTFCRGRAVFMDHTSFAIYEEGKPWCAYRQFVSHFLCPLLLMQKKDLRLSGLLKNDINGIPLDLASALLPWRSWLDFNVLFHIHLHAAFEKRYSDAPGKTKEVFMPQKRLTDLLDSMKNYIAGLKFPARRTQWAGYSGECSYQEESLLRKKEIVDSFCHQKRSGTICDLGAAGGEFSIIAARHADLVLAADMDPCAVEELFNRTKEFPNIQALLCDLNNPTPSLGVFNEERSSFFERFKGDAVLGLALIHHLRITGNWSLEQIVRLFRQIAPKALVEFIPLDDPKTQQLLRGRENLCPEWNLENVTKAFLKSFRECRHHHLPGTGRVLLELDD